MAAWLSSPLSASIISFLLLSCLSQSPEEDVPDVEIPQSQEEEFPALSDTSGELDDGDLSDSAPSPLAPPEFTVDDADSEAPAAADPIPETADLEAEGPETASVEPDDGNLSDSAPSPLAPPEFTVDDADSEAPAAADLIPEAADLEAEGPETASVEPDDGNLSDSAPSPLAPPEFAVDDADSEAPAAAAASSQHSEVVENNPLLPAEGPAANSAETKETKSAASRPASSEIVPSIAERDSEQLGQPDETSGDAAVSAAAPARLLEAPGELTIILESIGWIFRSDRSTPGAWRFLGRDIIGDSTSFRFLFSENGKWNLVFERQDLSSGKSEEAIRRVAVNEIDDSPIIENGPLPLASPNPISGMPPADTDTRYLAALGAAEAGKIDEAIKYYEQDASRNDSDGARARSALVETAAKFGTVGPLLTWLPRYLEDNPSPEVLRAALEVFLNEAGYDNQSRIILEKLAESENDQPEWLYRLAFLLEKPGEERDLDRATRLYREVVNSWPLSEWRDRSEERLLWLQRHYFRIR